MKFKLIVTLDAGKGCSYTGIKIKSSKEDLIKEIQDTILFGWNFFMDNYYQSEKFDSSCMIYIPHVIFKNSVLQIFKIED